MPEELRPHLMQILAIGGGAIALWFFWKLARAVVKWGFFVMYFVIGGVLAWVLQPSPSVGVTLSAGLVFAWTVMAIRSKLWKLIGAAAVVIAIPFFAPVGKALERWTQGEKKPTPLQEHPIRKPK